MFQEFIDIICGGKTQRKSWRSAEELNNSIVQLFKVKLPFIAVYSRDLESDVQSETSGNFKKFLTSLLQVSSNLK